MLKIITATHRQFFSKYLTMFFYFNIIVYMLWNIRRRGRFRGTPYFQIMPSYVIWRIWHSFCSHFSDSVMKILVQVLNSTAQLILELLIITPILKTPNFWIKIVLPIKSTNFCESKFLQILRILARFLKLNTHEISYVIKFTKFNTCKINFKNSKFNQIFYSYLERHKRGM